MMGAEYIGNGYNNSASLTGGVCPAAVCPLDGGCAANACGAAGCGANVCGVDGCAVAGCVVNACPINGCVADGCLLNLTPLPGPFGEADSGSYYLSVNTPNSIAKRIESVERLKQLYFYQERALV